MVVAILSAFINTSVRRKRLQILRYAFSSVAPIDGEQDGCEHQYLAGRRSVDRKIDLIPIGQISLALSCVAFLVWRPLFHNSLSLLSLRIQSPFSLYPASVSVPHRGTDIFCPRSHLPHKILKIHPCSFSVILNRLKMIVFINIITYINHTAILYLPPHHCPISLHWSPKGFRRSAIILVIVFIPFVHLHEQESPTSAASLEPLVLETIWLLHAGWTFGAVKHAWCIN